MYPEPVKLTHTDGMSVCVNDATESVSQATVEFERNAGTGYVEITFEGDTPFTSKVMISMSPDEALMLADTLRLYANASKRIKTDWKERMQAKFPGHVFGVDYDADFKLLHPNGWHGGDC